MRTIINSIDLGALRERLHAADQNLPGSLLELLGGPAWTEAVEALLAGERGRSDAPEILDALVGVLGYQAHSVDLPTEELEALASAELPPGPALARLLANRGPDGEPLHGPMRVGFFAADEVAALRAGCTPEMVLDAEQQALLEEDLLPALDAVLAVRADLYLRSM